MVSGIVGGMKQTKILITGFGPFPGVPDNPSAALVRTLARGEFNVAARVLPTAYDAAWPLLAQAIAEEAPDIVICFGVASGSTAIRIEQQARNVVGTARADSTGQCHAQDVVCADGPVSYPSTLPMVEIAAALGTAGLPAEMSESAGDYLCNYIFYKLMHDIVVQGRGYAGGFVHIPMPRADTTLDAEGLAAAGRVIIQACRVGAGPR